MLATLGVNLAVVRYESARGRALQERAAAGRCGAHAERRLTSCAVLVSLAGVGLGYPRFDPIGGLMVAVFIARTGFQIARETSGILSDRVVMTKRTSAAS